MNRTFDLSKYKLMIPDPSTPDVEGTTPRMVQLVSVELREMTGEDEIAAVDLAQSLMPSGRTVGQIQITEASIATAMVAVNGTPVSAPWWGAGKWRAKVRDFLRVAYRSMNDATSEDIEDFAKAVAPAREPSKRG